MSTSGRRKSGRGGSPSVKAEKREQKVRPAGRAAREPVTGWPAVLEWLRTAPVRKVLLATGLVWITLGAFRDFVRIGKLDEMGRALLVIGGAGFVIAALIMERRSDPESPPRLQMSRGTLTAIAGGLFVVLVFLAPRKWKA